MKSTVQSSLLSTNGNAIANVAAKHTIVGTVGIVNTSANGTNNAPGVLCPEAARLQARVTELETICKACDLTFWFLMNAKFADRHEAKRANEAMTPARRLLRPFEPMISYSLTHGMSPLPDPALEALVAIATLDPEEGETAAVRAHRMQQIALDAIDRLTCGIGLTGTLGEDAAAQNAFLQSKIEADNTAQDMWDRIDDIFFEPGTLPEPLPVIAESEVRNV